MEYLSDHIIAPRLSNILTTEWSEQTTASVMWFVTALRVAAILDPVEREFGRPRGIKKLFGRAPKQYVPEIDQDHDWSKGYYS